MPTLIDGDNLLGTWLGGRRTGSDRRALALEIDRLARRERRRILLVYDGAEPPTTRFGESVVFAGKRSADDEILSRLEREADRRGWTVVTSDRSLADRCRWLGARVVRSQDFRARLRADCAGEKPERETNLQAWLREFGEES